MESPEILEGQTREAFFRKAAVSLAGTSAIMAGLPSLASAASLPESDIEILNFALTLEYLEAEFYAQAKDNIPSGPAREFASLVAEHEAEHVKALKGLLRGKAVKKPKFDFGNAVTDLPTFLKTAFVLENTGVHAYLGQAGKLKTPALLGAAASIVTVEARHAAAIALVTDQARLKGPGGITPQGGFDTPKSKAAILKAVKATGFIKS
jgi:rubrerythrin